MILDSRNPAMEIFFSFQLLVVGITSLLQFLFLPFFFFLFLVFIISVFIFEIS